jgi:hypothetical protein
MSRRTRSHQIDTSDDFFVDRLFVSDLPQPGGSPAFLRSVPLVRFEGDGAHCVAVPAWPSCNGGDVQAAVSCGTVCCATVSCGMLPGEPGDGSRII